jgi:hypothetical protein
MGEPSKEEMELLRIRARERITQGRLPRTKAVRTWGGMGAGLPCSLCDAAILSSEPEFELQFDASTLSGPIRFHRQCHIVWSEVREEHRPSEWRLVSEELPAAGALVEARVSLGEGRSIILSVICSDDPEGARLWVNATTGGPLPAGWQPLEWRHPSGRSHEADRIPEPRRRSDPVRSDESRRSAAKTAEEPHDPPLPRRA